VVDLCLRAQGACALAPGEGIDARELACGSLTDVAAALTGMRPRDIWVTRLEASLPLDALDKDLELESAEGAPAVAPWLTPRAAVNAPCPLAQPAVLARAPMWAGPFAGALALLVGVLARRAARARRQ
jgi:hypothetical protein